MKKIYTLLFAAVLAAANLAKAQNIYAFTYTSSPYSALVSPTIIATNSGFNNSTATIPLGFNFSYWQTNYSTLYVTTYAYFGFTGGNTFGFYPMYAALKGLGNSQIAYEESGISGNRILKVEFKDVGFSNDPTNTDSASFQVWIYETFNTVEMHFGVNSINPAHFFALFGSNSGPQVVFDLPSGASYYNLQGNAAAPTMLYKPTSYIYLNGYAPNGTVYIFNYKPAGTAAVSSFLSPANGCFGAALTPTNNSTGNPAPTFQWSVTPAAGVTFSPGSSNPTPQIVFPTAGQYTLTCTATNSLGTNASSKTVSIAVCDAGLEENQFFADGFILSPNPSEGIFSMTTTFTDPKKLKVQVLDLLGQTIVRPENIPLSGNCFTFDLRSQGSGVYFLSISDGKSQILKRIINTK